MVVAKSITAEQKGGISHNFDVRDRWKLYLISQIGPEPKYTGKSIKDPDRPGYSLGWTSDPENDAVIEAYERQVEGLLDAVRQWALATGQLTDEQWSEKSHAGVDLRCYWTERYLDEEVAS